jgi:hypothetical protein
MASFARSVISVAAGDRRRNVVIQTPIISSSEDDAAAPFLVKTEFRTTG